MKPNNQMLLCQNLNGSYYAFLSQMFQIKMFKKQTNKQQRKQILPPSGFPLVKKHDIDMSNTSNYMDSWLCQPEEPKSRLNYNQ